MRLPMLLSPGAPVGPSWYGTDAKDWHVFQSGDRPFLFVTDGSRVYEVDPAVRGALERMPRSDVPLPFVLAAIGVPVLDRVKDEAPAVRAPRSFSLAVVQKCNLGCTYCYAQEGEFGAQPAHMSQETAFASVDRLFNEVSAGERVNLAFMGGEPMLNRSLVRRATEYAVRTAEERGAQVGFSITTNGTLLTADDAAFFERYAFAVTVSLDGVGEAHDRLRPFKSGRGSFATIRQRLEPLLCRGRGLEVSARVTVTPQNLSLRETLDELVGWGFTSVGFSPMLSSPTGRDEMTGESLNAMLEQMVDCGREFERRVLGGQQYPFSNLTGALREIHRGTHQPYPCGAGAGYFGVSAEGDLWACHRFVNDEVGAMGHVTSGVDASRQREWLAGRHVDTQEPCRGCWARYLCGGGCHHEVIHRGRPSCDYIRGWLNYCLGAYVRLQRAVPTLFSL